MSQWEDYTGDEWMRPLASQDTRTKHILDRETQGIKPRPRLQAPPFKAGDTWGEFTLDEWLGSGTHGWVFAARENATEKPVALKILAVEDDPGTTLAKTGFRRMAKLNHRNLMRLHGIHEHDKTVAFSMERIDGVNLTTAIRRWRNEPLDVACEHITEMVRQIGSAIGWMHARELVHRDLKPSNIMVTDDYKRFVVIDYDSAGMFQEHDAESMRAYLIWTPMYVAPEVLVRQRHTPSSDVFSLGMVVLEALRVFSAAQYRREGSLKVESRPTDGSDESLGIRRDKSNEKQDRMLITNAVRGLHPSIPADLLETLDEMLAPDEADRPMAMTLSRLGRPLETMQMTRITTSTAAAFARRPSKSAMMNWREFTGGATWSWADKSNDCTSVAIRGLASQHCWMLHCLNCDRFLGPRSSLHVVSNAIKNRCKLLARSPMKSPCVFAGWIASRCKWILSPSAC